MSPQIFAEIRKLHLDTEKQLTKTYIVIYEGHSYAFSFARNFRFQPNKRDLLVTLDDEIKKITLKVITPRVTSSETSGEQPSALLSHSLFTQEQCAESRRVENKCNLEMRSSQEENEAWHVNTLQS